MRGLLIRPFLLFSVLIFGVWMLAGNGIAAAATRTALAMISMAAIVGVFILGLVILGAILRRLEKEIPLSRSGQVHTYARCVPARESITGLYQQEEQEEAIPVEWPHTVTAEQEVQTVPLTRWDLLELP